MIRTIVRISIVIAVVVVISLAGSDRREDIK